MMREDIYEMSDKAIVLELGKQFKEYRLSHQKTQKQVAEHVGISIFSISSFEKGTGTGISMLLFIKLLRGIDELDRIREVLPEISPSPRQLFELQQKIKTRKRVRKPTSDQL